MTWEEHNNAGKCRSCGADIIWGLTKNGKRCPFDADGTSHFATCPNAKRHSDEAKAKRAARPTGQMF